MEGVRTAEPGDLERCTELLSAARRAAGGRGAGLPGAPLAGPDTVADWLVDGPSRLVLVGTFQGAVVGLATGHVASEGPGEGAGRRLGTIDCCYVEPAARDVGVGGAMMTELVGWFGRQGCTGIDAPALPGDRETKRLYEAAGFKARLLVLHRPLR